MVKKTILLVVICTFAALLFAQTEWSAYTYPYNMLCMLEEDDNLLFGSALSMLKVDKETHTSEILNTSNYPIETNYVNAISKDSEGNIWIGHVHNYVDEGENVGGITVIHPDGTTTRYTMANSGLAGHLITDIEFDNDGLVWISYGFRMDSMGGITSFNPQTGEWNHYNKSNSALNANSVMSLFKDSSGMMWAALTSDYDEQLYMSLGGGICKLDPAGWVMYDDEICPVPVGYNEPENWEVMNIDEDSEGNLWFGLGGNVPCDTDGYGLYKFDGTTFECNQATGTALDYYWFVDVAPDDKVWVNSYIEAVGYFDNNGWTVYNDFEGWMLQRMHITSENEVWVSVYEGGLFYLQDDSFVELEYGYDNCPITYNSVWDINVSDAGEVYFGTGWYPFAGTNCAESALLCNTFGAWNKWGYDDFTNYIVKDVKFMDNGDVILATGVDTEEACAIYNMYGGVTIKHGNDWVIHNTFTTGYPYLAACAADMDANGNIWAASWTSGLAVYDGSSWTQYHPDNSPLYTDTISDIVCIPGTNDIWIASVAGLYLVDASDLTNLQWDVFLPSNSNLPTGYITNLYVDRDDVLWACTADGVCSYDGYEWTSYQDLTGVIGARRISQDECGRYWIATDTDGLMMMDGTTVQTFDVESSCLPSNTITALASDGFGHLWLSPHNGGIYCYEYEVTSTGELALIPVTDINHHNYPNPFNPETSISFDLPQTGMVSVDIFNAKGQKVCRLAHEEMQAGAHSLQWNGKDANDQPVASGMYFYKINFNGNTYSDKMMLLK
jgi:ligand-binding sensor domain-containing protein